MNCMYGLGALLGLNLIMLILLLFFNSCPMPIMAKSELWCVWKWEKYKSKRHTSFSFSIRPSLKPVIANTSVSKIVSQILLLLPVKVLVKSKYCTEKEDIWRIAKQAIAKTSLISKKIWHIFPVVRESVGQKQVRILRWEIGYLSKKPVWKRILAERKRMRIVEITENYFLAKRIFLSYFP